MSGPVHGLGGSFAGVIRFGATAGRRTRNFFGAHDRRTWRVVGARGYNREGGRARSARVNVPGGNTMSETEAFQTLIERVRAGDEGAAAELVRRYEPMVRRAARVRSDRPEARPRARLDGHLPVGDGQLLRPRRARASTSWTPPTSS